MRAVRSAAQVRAAAAEQWRAEATPPRRRWLRMSATLPRAVQAEVAYAAAESDQDATVDAACAAAVRIATPRAGRDAVIAAAQPGGGPSGPRREADPNQALARPGQAAEAAL
jgi:hypothetical protein